MWAVERVMVGSVVAMLALAAVAGAALAADTDGDAAGSVEVEPSTLVSASASSLGPVQGLNALVEHLAFGDPAATLEPGANGTDVVLLQSRLESLGFRPGSIDGTYGGQTVSAVLAFQKHEGLERTGSLDPATRAAMGELREVGPRPDILGDRIEIDLTRQIIFLVQDGATVIINTSTGNGEAYTRQDGSTAIARTPLGDFAIGTRYDGNQVGYLGTLYRPMYFYGPYAIHGSGSVPAYPASHGCARTSFGDMDFLWTTTPTGMQVYSY
jgi:N-acetylmuramoyl-L-alanine amidase